MTPHADTDTTESVTEIVCAICGETLEWYPSDGRKPRFCAECQRTASQEDRNAAHRREAARGPR